MTEILILLAINLVGLLAVITLLWRYACAIRDASFIDAFWAFGMVLLAWGTAWQVGDSGQRGALILGLTTLWGLRLSWHLWVRWRAHGEDPRYKKIIGGPMERNGWSWERTALQVVFLLRCRCCSSPVCPRNWGSMLRRRMADCRWGYWRFWARWWRWSGSFSRRWAMRS